MSKRPVDKAIARIHEGHCPDCATRLLAPDRLGWLACPTEQSGCGARWMITTISGQLYPAWIRPEMARTLPPTEPIGAGLLSATM